MASRKNNRWINDYGRGCDVIGHGERQIPEIHVRVSSQAARRFVLSASNGVSPLEFARLNYRMRDFRPQSAHGRPRVLNAVYC